MSKIRFTEWKYYEPATILSSLFLGISSGLRIYFLIHGFFPYSKVLLLVFGLHGIFRSLMSFGLVLTGSLVWKEILEQASKNAPRILPALPPNNFDPENSNDNESKNKNNKKTENSEENKNNTKDSYWVKAGVIGSLVSAGVASYALIGNPYEKTIELQKEQIKFEKSRADLYKEEVRIEKSRADLHKEEVRIEKNRADFYKERADFYKELQRSPVVEASQNNPNVRKQAEETAKKEVNDFINKNKK